MIRRGDPRPPKGQRMPTIGQSCERYEKLHLICHDCNPEGLQFSARDFAVYHKLPPRLTLWRLTQRLYCQSCGSRNVSLDTVSPSLRGPDWLLARKGIQR